MTANRTVTRVSACRFLVLFAGSVFSLREVDAVRGKEATLEEVLYLPSGKTVKHLSLGYSSLLADIYWTRAVQYFGGRHGQSARYDLLYPLLDITTDLDPHLIEAYQSGSVFLSQRLPGGAGQPDKAVALLEKGVRENPLHWRLYFTLGFVHYIDRHDPKSAQIAFQRGSEVHGALPWMKVMAARMAERSKDITTSMILWQAISETTVDKTIRESAQLHLASLLADRDITELERLIKAYRQANGAQPSSWLDLIRAGLLKRVPLTPYGDTYLLKPGGTVDVGDASKYPYLGEWRNNVERPF